MEACGNLVAKVTILSLSCCIIQATVLSLMIRKNKLPLLLIGVEKQNDESKKIYFNSSNKWDAPRDILATDYKLHVLNSIKRTTRKYT